VPAKLVGAATVQDWERFTMLATAAKFLERRMVVIYEKAGLFGCSYQAETSRVMP